MLAIQRVVSSLVLAASSCPSAFAQDVTSMLLEPVRHEITVAAAPDRVFAAWTTEAGVEAWFAPAAHIELEPGGAYVVSFDLDAPAGRTGSEGCRVLSWIENEMFSFSWNAPSRFGALRGLHGFVVLRLHTVEDGAGPRTRVELEHGGLRAVQGMDVVREHFEEFWPRALGRLADHFAENAPGADAADDAARADASDDDDARARAEPERALRTYAILIRPPDRRTVMDPSPETVEAMGGHVAHVTDLWANGRLLLAGPCLGDTILPSDPAQRLESVPDLLGLVLIRAVDDADAKRLMERDPAVKAGVFQTCVTEFELSFEAP